jgi:hypothetical protein
MIIASSSPQASTFFACRDAWRPRFACVHAQKSRPQAASFHTAELAYCAPPAVVAGVAAGAAAAVGADAAGSFMLSPITTWNRAG